MPRAPQSNRKRTDRRTRGARAERRDARSELLAAAAEVFAERGYRDASVDEVAARAGYSKGAVYWHFSGKEDLFFALMEERVDRPTREMIDLLESAPPDQDMGPEASRRFVELMQSERELLLLRHEYWSQAVRDPKLRARYAKRQAKLRKALGKALVTRVEHLGGPADPAIADQMATAAMALASGLAQERLIDSRAVPDGLFGDTMVLLYAGLVARGERARS
jgi:AcrR family transcriptional regulator